MAHEVFVAHATQDTAAAEAVCAGLEAVGIFCWMAPRDVKPGRPYAGEITRAIKSSKVMLLLVSHAANASEHVLREVELATHERLHILQLRIEPAELSDDFRYFLSLPQWVDALTPPLEQHMNRLIKGVRALLPTGTTPPPSHSEKAQLVVPPAPGRPSRQPVSRSVKIMSAVFAAAVIATVLAFAGYRLFAPARPPPPIAAAPPSPTPASSEMRQQSSPSPSTPLPASPRTLLVPDEFSTIQSAIDATRAGDTVMIKPGVYREAITFKDGIRLLGTEPGGCRLEPAESAAAVITAFNCQKGSIERLTVDGSNKKRNSVFEAGWIMEKERPTYIKKVKPGSPASAAGLRPGMRLISVEGESFIDAVITSYWLARGAVAMQVEIEVEAEGRIQKKVLRTAQVDLEGAWPDGIALMNSSVEVRNCIIEAMGGVGITARGARARPLLRNNQCRDNALIGIFFGNGAAGEADDNVCEGNGECGMDIYDPATAPTLRRNKCRSNGAYGIHFDHGCSGLAAENECEQNKSQGISVSGSGTTPTLRSNKCVSNGGSGLSFSDRAGGIAEQNNCTFNKQSGIYFSSGAAGKANGNTCQLNEWSGITVYGADTAPTLRDNKLLGNQQDGITIDKRAKNTVVNNNAYTDNKHKSIDREATFEE